jgi:serine/threonine-protein kinase
VRARGDLEAIAAKALRKKPQERYASVGALIDDLQRWLTHRPVSARRDDWRHRTGLWLRRNAVLAGALAVVLLSLSAGLAAATWQWQRAQAAARQSDRITGYLSELLSSARPDQHGGEWPTVLQLLERSRAQMPEAFQDDPQTRLRLLSVMASTYHELNCFDLSMPLYEELVSLVVESMAPANRWCCRPARARPRLPGAGPVRQGDCVAGAHPSTLRRPGAGLKSGANCCNAVGQLRAG